METACTEALRALRCSFAGPRSLHRLPRTRNFAARPETISRCAPEARTRADTTDGARGGCCPKPANHDPGPGPCQDHCKWGPRGSVFGLDGTVRSGMASGLADGPKRALIRAFRAANTVYLVMGATQDHHQHFQQHQCAGLAVAFRLRGRDYVSSVGRARTRDAVAEIGACMATKMLQNAQIATIWAPWAQFKALRGPRTSAYCPTGARMCSSTLSSPHPSSISSAPCAFRCRLCGPNSPCGQRGPYRAPNGLWLPKRLETCRWWRAPGYGAIVIGAFGTAVADVARSVHLSELLSCFSGGYGSRLCIYTALLGLSV